MFNDPQVSNPEQEGVSASSVEMPDQQGVPQEGMPEQGAADVEKLRQQVEDYQSKLAELEEARERDVSQLRSSLDSRHAQERAEYQRRLEEYESRMHEAAMAQMDEQERVAYRLQVAEENNRRLRQEREQAVREAQANAGMMQYAKGFMQQGVAFENLDFNNGVQGLYASGWQALNERNQQREQRLKELEQKLQQGTQSQQQQTQQQQQGIQQFLPGGRQQQQTLPTQGQNTPVLTQKGQQPSGTKTMGDVIKALEAQFPNQQFDEEKVFTWIERRYLSPDILEGIDWNQPIGV